LSNEVLSNFLSQQLFIDEELQAEEYVVNIGSEMLGTASLPNREYFTRLIVENYSQTKKNTANIELPEFENEN